MSNVITKAVLVIGTVLLMSLAFKANAASIGSGTAIGNGYFITAAHVVDSGGDVYVSLDNNTNRMVKAEIVYIDSGRDVAIIKASLKTKSVIDTWSVPSLGENIYSCGYSYYDLNHGCTFNRGYVNADFSYDGFTPVNNDIHPGDSGSGVVDKSGNLVGVVSASYMSDALNPKVGTQRLSTVTSILHVLNKAGLDHLLSKNRIAFTFYSQEGIARLVKDSSIFIMSYAKGEK